MGKRARRSSRAVDLGSIAPVDVDGVRTVEVGTLLFSVAFVVLALRKSRLDADGHTWWLWTCLAGVGLGLLGLEYCRVRRDRIRRARQRAEIHG